MEAAFWHDRWHAGQTHFHQQRITPLLPKYWPLLNLHAHSRILVPLCGKSLDMVWLAEQGHRILGIELSPIAVEQFFTERGLEAAVVARGRILSYRAGPYELLCGDIFEIDTAEFGDCAGVYDRAALVALPESMRQRYVEHVYGRLPADYRGLLITLDYAQDEMAGPPFSVGENETRALFGARSMVDCISRRDILDKEPKFAQRGVSKLDTLVFSLAGAAASA